MMRPYFARLQKKPKAARMGVRPSSVCRSAKHLRWIRTLRCIDPLCQARNIEAAHVRHGLPAGGMAGVGIKPADYWTVPLCREHHREAHTKGHETFEREHLPPGVTMAELAIYVYAIASPVAAIREKAQETLDAWTNVSSVPRS